MVAPQATALGAYLLLELLRALDSPPPATNTPTLVVPQPPAVLPYLVQLLSVLRQQATALEEYLHWVMATPPATNTLTLVVPQLPVVLPYLVHLLNLVLLQAGQPA